MRKTLFVSKWPKICVQVCEMGESKCKVTKDFDLVISIGLTMINKTVIDIINVDLNACNANMSKLYEF